MKDILLALGVLMVAFGLVKLCLALIARKRGK